MIGKLDQKIRIERQVRTPDGGGGSRVGFAALASDPEPWAKVKLLGGDEGALAGAKQARQVAEFTIRARADVNASDRILWGGYVWNITAKGAPVARSMYQTLIATAGALSQ